MTPADAVPSSLPSATAGGGSAGETGPDLQAPRSREHVCPGMADMKARLRECQDAFRAERANLEAELVRRERALAWLNEEVARREAFGNSDGRSLMPFLRRVRPYVAPRGSLRERILKKIYHGFRRRFGSAPAVPAPAPAPAALPAPAAAPAPVAPPVGAESADLRPGLIRRSADPLYQQWMLEHEPRPEDFDHHRKVAAAFRRRPLISIVTPTYNTPPAILRATVQSVLDQVYDHWELCLADGNSGTPELLNELAGLDPRIRIRILDRNLGISGNSNEALTLARGEYVALLDHDDLLPPDALFEIVRLLNEQPDADFIYTDKDMVSEDGRLRMNPFFKPEWSPDVLLSANYLTHLCVMRKSLVDAAGGFDSSTDGAQDWDLFLKVAERSRVIAHIPRVLYHWRHWSRSVASGIEAKPYALEAQKRTIAAHLDRIGVAGADVSMDAGLILRAQWPLPPGAKVSVVLATAGTGDGLEQCLASLLGNDRPPLAEIRVVHPGAAVDRMREIAAALPDGRLRFVSHAGAFHVSRMFNAGARSASGDVLVFLREGVRALTPDWLEELARWALRPGLGAVGPALLDGKGGLLKASLVAGLEGLAAPLAGPPRGPFGPFGSTEWYRNGLAVSEECVALRRDLFEALGGFDELYQRRGAVVDLCVRARERGARNLYTPFARLESLDGERNPWRKDDALRARERLLPFLMAGDPFYNPNLSRESTYPALRRKNEEHPLRHVNRMVDLLRWTERTTDGASVERPVEKIAPPRPDEDLYTRGANIYASTLDFTSEDLARSREVHRRNPGAVDVRSVNWFLPPFEHIYYGGIYTIFRLADYLRRREDVASRFLILGPGSPAEIGRSVAEAYPALSGSPIHTLENLDWDLPRVPYADAVFASLWSTSYAALKFNNTRRKFYIVQDYEPFFYPAGSTGAQAAATYRFGFYGIANTPTLKELYESFPGAAAHAFTPCVDTAVFRPRPDGTPRVEGPKRVFFYGRPNHPRNGFELGAAALRALKRRMGNNVRIYAAGAAWNPEDHGLSGIVENLGLLTVPQTAELYRTCDAGLVLMFTCHPSYLPFEMMASGCAVVSNHNPSTKWFFEDGSNCLLADASPSCLAETLDRALTDDDLRARVVAAAAARIRTSYSDWDAQMRGVYEYMRDPEAPPAPRPGRPGA